MREICAPYAFRDGMSDFYLGELAERLEQVPPYQEVGIGLVYAEHQSGLKRFLQAFYPFAVTAPVDPYYPTAWAKHQRRAELARFDERLSVVVERVRKRILLMRDVLSGQKFSPLTLPLRNFRSDVLDPSIKAIFEQLGTCDATRDLIDRRRDEILAAHPLKRLDDGSHRPYFEDNRRLRFKSPGSDNHGVVRVVAEGHQPACLINGRVRLGATIRTGFHYDCEYDRGTLDSLYPNCHGEDVAPSRDTHVNISPSDAIR